MYESLHSSLVEDFARNLQSPGSSTAAGDDFFDSRTSYLKYYREKVESLVERKKKKEERRKK